MSMCFDFDEFKIQYLKIYDDKKSLEQQRIFSDPDKYLILGVYNRRLLEMEHSTSDFFVKKNNLRKYRRYELFVY